MPLYLFNEHFTIAQEKMKRIFGFMCTLDPFGYTKNMLFTVPFLVLHKAFIDLNTDPSNSKKKEIFNLVL